MAERYYLVTRPMKELAAPIASRAAELLAVAEGRTSFDRTATEADLVGAETWRLIRGHALAVVARAELHLNELHGEVFFGTVQVDDLAGKVLARLEHGDEPRPGGTIAPVRNVIVRRLDVPRLSPADRMREVLGPLADVGG
jgi:hypothetical protein